MEHASERKANRLRGYDYSQNGAYFFTACTKDRIPLLPKYLLKRITNRK